LTLEPANPEILNNLAWLYLTCEDLGLRDPMRALTLARSAAIIQPKGFVLDTLATAYWANGFVEEAVNTEKQAAFADPGEQPYYLSQIARFTSQTYRQAMQGPATENMDQAREGEKNQPVNNGG
jgi:hypothetical protein